MKTGFTLLELMVVLVIIAFLAMLAAPNFFYFLAKAKRAEAYTQLRGLYLSEQAYFAEHGSYTKNLNHLGWKPQGEINYTYGFSGTSGTHYFKGTLKAGGEALKGTYADDKGFKIGAAGNIDNDKKIDYVTIDHRGHVTVENDDLI